jgi:hypothetical protein
MLVHHIRTKVASVENHTRGTAKLQLDGSNHVQNISAKYNAAVSIIAVWCHRVILFKSQMFVSVLFRGGKTDVTATSPESNKRKIEMNP